MKPFRIISDTYKNLYYVEEKGWFWGWNRCYKTIGAFNPRIGFYSLEHAEVYIHKLKNLRHELATAEAARNSKGRYAIIKETN